ncbi:MAG: valine--tRNA ligase, partial [Cellvibrionales bacterium]
YPRDPDAEADIAWLQGVIVAVRTIRGEAQLGPGKMLNVLIRNASPDDQLRLLEHAALLKKLARLESIDTVPTDNELPPVLSALHKHLEVLVPMAGVVDLDDERDRLTRELGKQQKELARLEAKLGNANFVDRAPEEVVAGERLKQQAASDAVVKISSQLDRLKGLH